MERARIAIWLLALSALAATARADTPSVTAVLGNSEAVVGRIVQMQVQIRGSMVADAPERIAADGLEIHRTGQTYESQFNFGTGGNHNSSVVTYIYSILPQKPGTFKIPPQTIQVGSTSLRTPELTLHVTGSPSRQATAPPPGNAIPNPGNAVPNQNSQIDTTKLAFAELIIPKKTAYVGEVIPTVIRMGFAARFGALDGPHLDGQGFTVQKMQTVSEQGEQEVINGRPYRVFTFKTAIAPARPGKLEIGPVTATTEMLVPSSSRRQRSRSPFDAFSLDDFFNDPFSADPFGRMEKKEVNIASQPATLEVKPLPANAPANFGGAIGNFTMTVEANPKSVQVGDPITVTATISGRGNFDRVTAPALQDERGWHKYPPSSKFKQDDEVGISGTKTLETVFSPNEKKSSVPPFTFSFFDPAKEQYVTLKSDAIPIQVEGGNAPAAPAASVAPAVATTAAPSPAAKTPDKPADILYQLNERPARSRSFVPLFARREFWLAQLIPAIIFLAFLGWKIRKNRATDRESQRIAALNHEAAELMRKLRRENIPPYEYYLNAARAIQIRTALAKKIDPNAVDPETAGAAFQLDEESRRQLRQLFSRSDELRYSGAHNGDQTISPENRREVLELIEMMHK